MLYAKILNNKKELIYLGHRGAPQKHKENTIKSFKAAIDLGADGVELDVRLTQDKKLIVFHDRTIQDIKGKQYFINRTKYKDIQEKFKENYNQKTCLLEEVLETINKDKIINIEIKKESIKKSTLETSVVNEIEKRNAYDQIIVSSFNYFVLQRIKKLNSKIKLAFLWGNHKQRAENYQSLISKIKPAFLHLDYNIATASKVLWAHKNNMFVNIYTVNKIYHRERCLEIEADGIFTDNHRLYNNVLL